MATLWEDQPCIVNRDLFRHSANFIDKEPSRGSDHSPITTWLYINTTDQNPFAPIINNTLLHFPDLALLTLEEPSTGYGTMGFSTNYYNVMSEGIFLAQ